MGKTVKDKIEETKESINSAKDAVLNTEVDQIKQKTIKAVKILVAGVAIVSVFALVHNLNQENEKRERRAKWAEAQKKRAEADEQKKLDDIERYKTWIPEDVSRDSWTVFESLPVNMNQNRRKGEHVNSYRAVFGPSLAIGESTGKPAVVKVHSMSNGDWKTVYLTLYGIPAGGICADFVVSSNGEQVLSSTKLTQPDFLNNSLYVSPPSSPLRNSSSLVAIDSMRKETNYKGTTYIPGNAQRLTMLKNGNVLEYRCSNKQTYRFTLMGFTKNYAKFIKAMN